MSDIYQSKEYLEHNPTWHEEDSPWKAEQIGKVLTSRFLDEKFPKKRIRILDIGSGFGTVLGNLKNTLEKKGFNIQGEGIDPSPDAVSTALEKWPEMKFTQKGIEEVTEEYDIGLLIDVIEHVPDPKAMLKDAALRCKYLVLHIPLDENWNIRLRNRYDHLRETVGHIHYFDTRRAKKLLHEASLDIIATKYTRKFGKETLMNKVAYYPRKVLSSFAPRMTAKVLGDISLMVLVQSPKAVKPEDTKIIKATSTVAEA